MVSKKAFALIFALLVIAPLALADTTTPPTPAESYGSTQSQGYEGKLGTSTAAGGTFGEWTPMAIAAIMICVLFNALLYMAGHALQSEEMKRYAKSEFLQVTASSLLIFFAVELLFGSVSVFSLMGEVIGQGSTIDCAAAPGGRFVVWHDGGPLAAFRCKVQEKITALEAQYDKVYEENIPNERLLSTCISLFGAPVYCWSWNLTLHKTVEEAHLVCAKIVGLLVPLQAQYSLALYMERNMLSVFLPLGLLLRITPLTRGIGGLFIAIAIGFFFVWPTFFLLTDPTFVKADERQGDQNAAGMCFTGFKGTSVLLSAVNIGTASGSSALATASGKELVYQISVATMFYPFVALVITLIFIRAATPLLGGDMGELMKMVGRLG